MREIRSSRDKERATASRSWEMIEKNPGAKSRIRTIGNLKQYFGDLSGIASEGTWPVILCEVVSTIAHGRSTAAGLSDSYFTASFGLPAVRIQSTLVRTREPPRVPPTPRLLSELCSPCPEVRQR